MTKPSPEMNQALIEKLNHNRLLVCKHLVQIRRFSQYSTDKTSFNLAIAVELRILDSIDAELIKLGVPQ
jgi:hypothetical protein